MAGHVLAVTVVLRAALLPEIQKIYEFSFGSVSV
jgi:hypothetical protein